MKLRLDYGYWRDPGHAASGYRYDYKIDFDAPDIKTKKDLFDYLREFAEEWRGEGHLEILSITDCMFTNPEVDRLSDWISGRIIKFKHGEVTIRRK